MDINESVLVITSLVIAGLAWSAAMVSLGIMIQMCRQNKA